MLLRVLLTPRMLAFHALVLLVVPSFVALGFWQYGRWEERTAEEHLQQANMAATPRAAQELTSVGEDVPPSDRWRPVTARGTYDTNHELLVRNRDGERGTGMYVLTPLVTKDGTALLVNRGWIELPPTATSQPDVPPAPRGTVTVTGRLQPRETEQATGIRKRSGLPEGQIMLVDIPRIAGDLPYPVYGGYAELTRQAPRSDPAPERVRPPEVNTWMNLSYAVQWWAFAGIAVGGWVVLVQREVRESRAGPPADADPRPRAGV